MEYEKPFYGPSPLLFSVTQQGAAVVLTIEGGKGGQEWGGGLPFKSLEGLS